MKTFIKKTNNGNYDIKVTFYNENKEAYYDYTVTYNKLKSIKNIINDFISWCPIKVNPSFVKIFTTPAWEEKIYNGQGKLLNINLN